MSNRIYTERLVSGDGRWPAGAAGRPRGGPKVRPAGTVARLRRRVADGKSILPRLAGSGLLTLDISVRKSGQEGLLRAFGRPW